VGSCAGIFYAFDKNTGAIRSVNALAHAVRQSGGVVAWVLSRMDVMYSMPQSPRISVPASSIHTYPPALPIRTG
jgi:hypothetical protein